MQADSADAIFKVLSSDNLIYGPIDLATLVQWVRERRVQRETWLYQATVTRWVTAGSIEALQPECDARVEGPPAAPDADVRSSSALPDELRNFERFDPYSNEDLALLLSFCDVVTAAENDLIIRKGDLSDS